MVNDSETEKNQEKSKKEAKVVNIFTVISAVFIVFAFIAPLLFTQCSSWVVFDDKTGPIGDTFGIMNPFIAIAAAIITFAAFWMQYEANRDLREQAEKDREDNQRERGEAEIRNRKQQIISRFYEMLQIHRENVKELEWNQKIHYEKDGNEDSFNQESECIQKRGRRIFYYYLLEFNFIYSIINSIYPDVDIKGKVQKAYNIFYRNSNDEKFDYISRKIIRTVIQNGYSADDVVKDICSFSKTLCNFFNDNEIVKDRIKSILKRDNYFKLQPVLEPHFEELNNYYRHLFLTVKTVANEDEKYLSFEEKRNLLRILRAQLTVAEQIMLFYNWFSENGRKWEENDLNGNHFFTQYRMIHNIMAKKLFPIQLLDGEKASEKLIDYLKEQPIYTYIKRFCSKEDPMFEFENRLGSFKFDYDK